MTTFDCTDIKALLSGIVDDELEPQARHEVERHLAQCGSCQALVDRTERVNQLVALEGSLLIAECSLPEGFEDAVCRRTVYGEVLHHAGHNWTSWLGWVAAAACLTLAVSIWVIDRQLVSTARSAENASYDTGHFAAGFGGRSWTSEVAQPTEAFMLPASQSASSKPATALVSLTSQRDSSVLHPEDSQTLYAASTALEMLTQSDLHSFADAERIRRIATYDDLVDRLAETRQRLDPADRAPVLAAESVLVRIVNGPLDLKDLRELHHTVAQLDLPNQVQMISQRTSL
jgi:hypothetical protein